MTLNDPLLKELKGHIISLMLGPDSQVDSRRSYGDENESVFILCHCLESIFLKGLVRYDGFTPWKADCFQWFYQVLRKYHKVLPLVFKTSFEDVLSDKKTQSHVGKTRLLIRTCLKRKCLHVPLEFHVKNKDFDDTSLRVTHRPNSSILGHEILSEIFLSLLLQLENINFSLDLSNSSFLDESWQMPRLAKFEMVPCPSLGLTLGFPLGFPVIVEILENSAAAELVKIHSIEIGDILDEINGITLRNLYGTKIETVFKKVRSEPFRITVIKGRDSKSSQVYLPIIKLYRILGLNPADTDLTDSSIEEPEVHQCPVDECISSENKVLQEQDSLLFEFSDEHRVSSDSMSTTQSDLLKSDGCPPSYDNQRFGSTATVHKVKEVVQQNPPPSVTENRDSDSFRQNSAISKFYGQDNDEFVV